MRWVQQHSLFLVPLHRPFPSGTLVHVLERRNFGQNHPLEQRAPGWLSEVDVPWFTVRRYFGKGLSW